MDEKLFRYFMNASEFFSQNQQQTDIVIKKKVITTSERMRFLDE